MRAKPATMVARRAVAPVLAALVALGLPLTALAQPTTHSSKTHVPAKNPVHPKTPEKPKQDKPKQDKPKQPVHKTITNKVPRKAGTEREKPGPGVRGSISGDAPTESRTASADLGTMHEVDGLLFPEATMPSGSAGATSGLPPEGDGEGAIPNSTGGAATDVTWLSSLTPPDIPYRWDARLIRYLEYFKDDPKGRSMVAGLLRRSGRYIDEIQKRLRARGMPEDIVWLSVVESGMDPRIASPAGAAGLWQFMPKAGTAYGLRMDKWVDERLDPERSTEAALDYLTDLNARFGRWEMAFAAYNMGHGGLLTSVRKYNTNDYWELSRFESGVPYETALYVPKILALAFVAHNRSVFGIDAADVDAPEPFVPEVKGDKKPAKSPGEKPGGDKLASDKPLSGKPDTDKPIADKPVAAKPSVDRPSGKSPAGKLPADPPKDAAPEQPVATVTVTVRWGESLEAIASDHATTEAKIRALNGMTTTVPPRPGTSLIVPASLRTTALSEKFVAVVPSRLGEIPGRKQIFYEVVWGDGLDEVASALGVTTGELCQWNDIDPSAKLHGKMVLQAFVPEAQPLANVRYVAAADANILTVNSQGFFDYFEGKNGRTRIVVTAGKGDTWASLAKKYGATTGQLERINQRSHTSKLVPGESVVVYAKAGTVPKSTPAAPSPSEPTQPTIDLDDDEGAAISDPARPDLQD
ncbi:MAG: transglycosylase SLT domain-containing protein [Polyangiaceae bacterium]